MKSGQDWHALEHEELLETLETSTDRGLSTQEVERRLQAIGPKQLEEAKPVTIWQMIWGQLNSFVVYLLIIALAISAVLGDYLEAGVILAIVVLNTILGSAVYVGKWQKEAVEFLKANEKILASRPVWLFSSGPTGGGDPLELMEGVRLPPALQPVVDRI